VENRAGKLVLVPGRADVVRRIFAMSADGWGHSKIVKRLTAEGVPGFVVERMRRHQPVPCP
jgi:hypothetical protein